MVAAILVRTRAMLVRGDTWQQEMVACRGVLVVGGTSRQASPCETSDASLRKRPGDARNSSLVYVSRVRATVREDSLRERSPAVDGHVRDCRDMSLSHGLPRARYSRAVLESGWHLVPCVLCYVMLC